MNGMNAGDDEVGATGIEWLDALMGRGHAPGEVNAVVGPEKTGKSTLIMQLANRASLSAARRASRGGPCRYAHYFTHEGVDGAGFHHRFVSMGARIRLSRLRRELRDNAEGASHKGELLPYEREMYAAEGREAVDDLPGEAERRAWWIGGPARHLRAHHALLRRGADEAAAVVNILRREADEGREAAGVFIDDAGAADGPGRASARAVAALREHVAKKFECPVWVAALSRGAGAGAEGREDVGGDFVFRLEAVGAGAGGVRLRVGRSRRGAPEGREIVLRFHEDFWELRRLPAE